MVRYRRREDRSKKERNDEKNGQTKVRGKEFERKKESRCKLVV